MKLPSTLVVVLFFSTQLFAQTVGLTQHNSGSIDDGFVLFAPISNTTTYLIDKCGKEINSWPSQYRPGQSVYLLEDGTLLRSGNANNANFDAGGKGGIIERIDWDGNVIWSFTISDITKCQHHDIKWMPNGHILVIAWESKAASEAISEGRDPSLVTATVWSEQVLELEPIGTNGANIVWEWHLWDHLIQDHDANLPNYGTVADHPELLDVNFKASATNEDWIHLNSIDYNVERDEVLLSSHSFNEVWIIDHSTTTQEAAGHSGGTSGKGGDLLYRWGNPVAYQYGSPADQKLFGQHNAHWIDSGFAYARQIMIFNNGLARPSGNYSSVEIIEPPISGGNYSSTLPYLPLNNSWRYVASNPTDLFAQNISGAHSMKNGHVLICNGPAGTFLEIDENATPVWQYVNPVKNGGTIPQNTTPSMNIVFRCTFYPSNYPGFAGKTLSGTQTIENANPMSDSCALYLALYQPESKVHMHVYPNPAVNFIYVQFDSPIEAGASLAVYDQLGQMQFFYDDESLEAGKMIDISNLPKGLYIVRMISNEVTSGMARFAKD